MRERRVDRIREILERLGGRARVGTVVNELRRLEGDDDLQAASLHIAIRNENDRLEEAGEEPAFVTRREGESWGFVRLAERTRFKKGTKAANIDESILAANQEVDKELRFRLAKMDWRTFESSFLTLVLEKLGFQNVEITQATRDGGVDARVTYNRGIVTAKAIVSAKHWNQASVPAEEVRHLRGIKGDEDTGIIVTSGKFSAKAREEAQPGQNQRVIFLIDGEQLVEICKRHGIGVQKVPLPDLLALDESFGVDEVETTQVGTSSAEDDEDIPDGSIRRLRLNMLGDAERGLAVEELAELLDLSEATVRTYLYSKPRCQRMLEELRSSPELRSRALQIVSMRRATAADGEAEEVSEDSPRAGGGGRRRLREEMLGDTARGLAIPELARLTGYTESTLRSYLGNPERRRQVLDVIRQDSDLREQALAIVAEKRGYL